MIIMTMRGGLGNQMFEYAFARALSLKYKNEKLYLYIERFKYDRQREYSLNHLVLNSNVVIVKKSFLLKCYIKFFELIRSKMHLDEKKVDDALQLYKFGYYMYLGRKYIELPECRVPIKYYSTLAQNKKYYSQYRDTILQELRVKTVPSIENKKWLDKIIATANSVCVHVRRGDYINNELYYICDDEYFRNAIRKMESILKGSYFIFCEDIDYAKKIGFERFTSQVEYVDMNNPDYEELRLMYHCEHFIISNSTFSWWAQELSVAPNKIVISPTRWKNSDLPEDSQLIDCEWIKIE